MERVLGSGLADRAGDRDHPGGGTGARRGGEVAERREHVGHDEQRRVRRHLLTPLGGDDRERGAVLESAGDEVVAVAVLAADGKERLAPPDGAAVDGEAGDARRQRPRARRAHRGGHRLDGPQGAIAHATFSLSAAATAA
jgi:hypothetical protein